MHPPLLNRLLSKTFAFQSIVCAWQSNKNRRSVDKLCIFTFLQTSFRHGETALEKFSHINGRPVYLFIKMPYCLLKTVSLNVTSGFILVRTKATDKGFVRMSFHLHNEPSKHFIECTQNPRRVCHFLPSDRCVALCSRILGFLQYSVGALVTSCFPGNCQLLETILLL